MRIPAGERRGNRCACESLLSWVTGTAPQSHCSGGRPQRARVWRTAGAAGRPPMCNAGPLGTSSLAGQRRATGAYHDTRRGICLRSACTSIGVSPPPPPPTHHTPWGPDQASFIRIKLQLGGGVWVGGSKALDPPPLL